MIQGSCRFSPDPSPRRGWGLGTRLLVINHWSQLCTLPQSSGQLQSIYTTPRVHNKRREESVKLDIRVYNNSSERLPALRM